MSVSGLMTTPVTPVTPVTPPSSASPGDVQISGRWLLVARVMWLLLFASNIWESGVAFGKLHEAALHPCAASNCILTPEQATTMQGVGFSVSGYAGLITILACVLTGIGSVMALALFWRRSNTRITLAVGVFLFSFSTGNITNGLSFTVISPVVDNSIALLNLGIAFSVFMIFPDGRFIPRWTWIVCLAWVGFHVALRAVPGTSWLDAFYPVFYLTALGVQFYRYQRVSNTRQQQQTKFVVSGFIVTLLSNILYWIILPLVFPALNAPGSLYAIIGYPLYLIVGLILPISVAIAIQRFQLFDVDALINRALVYGSLMTTLATLYLGLIYSAQLVIRTLTGQTSQPAWVIVLSTLLIAALFQPLRYIIQTTIDRRFYRQKYDAARTLEAFGATLRSEVELNNLTEHLLAVVNETMRPTHLSLWLRSEAAHRKSGDIS